jgi:hypothetical protein
MHYGRCPIIFNVMEALKKEVRFEWKGGASITPN